MRHSRNPESSDSSDGRGGRCIVPGSVGSKASVSPSATAVTILIQRICAVVMGSVSQSRTATTIAAAAPPLVGKVHSINLRRLS